MKGKNRRAVESPAGDGMCFDNANLQPLSIIQNTNKPRFNDGKATLRPLKPFTAKDFAKKTI